MPTLAQTRKGGSGKRQRISNNIGASLIELESSWWGHEKLGAWSTRWWVRVDHETEKAIHVSESSDNGNPHESYLRECDVWLPKSKVTVVVEPEWEITSPEGEVKGELVLGAPHQSQYGAKVGISGDTYEAFKEDDLADSLPWEETHRSWDGDQWVIDATEQAISILEDQAVEMGYRVKQLP